MQRGRSVLREQLSPGPGSHPGNSFAADPAGQHRIAANPSGVQTPRAVIEQLLVLIDKHAPAATLFIDETYREAAYGADPAIDSFAGLHPRIVTGASVSKALGAPGLRTGWLTVADADLRARLTVAKMNMVISGSVLRRNARRRTAASKAQSARTATSVCWAAPWRNWQRGARVSAAASSWVCPDAGALCCLRLRADAFDEAAVSRFWNLLPGRDLQLASGAWFGESARVFRLGFGYLPPERLGLALSALSAALDATALGLETV